MVPFAGYEMPVQYPAGVLKEHLHTREKAGLFDVSHMGQAFLTGDDRGDGARAPDAGGCRRASRTGSSVTALLLSDEGTIKDDFMFARLMDEPGLFLVVNAATKDDDFAYIAEKLDGAAVLEPQTGSRAAGAAGPDGGDGAEPSHRPASKSSPS